jgi:hypothetical protein
MSKWKEGQVPNLIWLSRKDLGAKGGARLMLGNVKCWTINMSLNSAEYVCYRLVPVKSKRRKKK